MRDFNTKLRNLLQTYIPDHPSETMSWYRENDYGKIIDKIKSKISSDKYFNKIYRTIHFYF